MKSKLIRVLIVAGSITGLGGCCTARRAATWEYKVAYAPGSSGDANHPATNRDPRVLEAFMNELGKDGWILVDNDLSGAFYFRREKR